MRPRNAAALVGIEMQKQVAARVDEIAEQAEVGAGLIVVLFAKLMEFVVTGGEVVAAGGLRGEEVRALHHHVFVVTLFRLAYAAECRRPSPKAGAEVAEQRSLDFIAEERTAADDREILLAPLRFEQEIVRDHAVVVQRVEADRIADRTQTCQVGDVAELCPALIISHFEVRADERMPRGYVACQLRLVSAFVDRGGVGKIQADSLIRKARLGLSPGHEEPQTVANDASPNSLFVNRVDLRDVIRFGGSADRILELGLGDPFVIREIVAYGAGELVAARFG